MFILHLRTLLFVVLATILSPAETTSGNNSDSGFSRTAGLRGVRSCGDNTLGNLSAVYLIGCDKVPCLLERKEAYEIFIAGVMYEHHEALHAVLKMRLKNGELPLVVTDACDKLIKEKCPFRKGKKYLFKVDMNMMLIPNTETLDLDGLVLSVRNNVTGHQLCADIPSNWIESSSSTGEVLTTPLLTSYKI